MARESSEETVYRDVTLPKGIGVIASTCELHSDPQVFPDPGEFKPERFLPDNRTPGMSFAWQVSTWQIGEGQPKNLIDRKFALRQSLLYSLCNS